MLPNWIVEFWPALGTYETFGPHHTEEELAERFLVRQAEVLGAPIVDQEDGKQVRVMVVPAASAESAVETARSDGIEEWPNPRFMSAEALRRMMDEEAQ